MTWLDYAWLAFWALMAALALDHILREDDDA